MIEERFQIGNLVQNTDQSIGLGKWGRFIAHRLTFPVYKNSQTVALLDISYPFLLTDHEENLRRKRLSPILVNIHQFDIPGVRVKEDEYLMLADNYSFAVHRTRVNEGGWEVDLNDNIGDLSKYRNLIENACAKLPYDSLWKSLDDVVGVIDVNSGLNN